MGIPEHVNDEFSEDSVESDSMLRAFSSPSTLPHLLALVTCSGFLYVAMKADIFRLEIQGGVLFLSLSISYFFAALVAPSKIGEWIFKVNHDGEGILNRNYWTGSFFRLIPIVTFTGAIWSLSNFALGDEYLNKVSIFLAALFIAMSVFQGISLTYGWIVYARRVQKSPRKGRVGGVFPIIRSVVAVLVFIPLVWWFGYGTEHPSDAKFSANIVWLLFLLIVALLGISLDRFTSKARGREGTDGVALDRVFVLIYITACWHILSAWRRSPFTVEQSSGGMLIEEGVLMSISILLAVWSMSQKGKKKGLRIFQGQSAIFWGIGFGFMYAGSISSLTALSEGSLLTTTAIGHTITAAVMIAILPVAIRLIGKPNTEEENQIPDTSDTLRVVPLQDGTDLSDKQTEYEEDMVELLD